MLKSEGRSTVAVTSLLRDMPLEASSPELTYNELVAFAK